MLAVVDLALFIAAAIVALPLLIFGALFDWAARKWGRK